MTPAGIGVEKAWSSLLNGRSGIRAISSFATEDYRTRIAGEVLGFNAGKFMNDKRMDNSERFAQFAVASTKLAIADSKISMREESKNMGVVVGCGMGGLPFFEIQAAQYAKRGPRAIRPSSVSRIMPNTAGALISSLWKICGPNLTVSTACSSSNHAVGMALDLIRSGRCTTVICGGTESLLSPITFGAFDSLRVMSSQNSNPSAACRPFDKNRDGFVMGEGAVMFVVEEKEHATARNASIYAEVAGYGASNGYHNVLAPDPEGIEAESSMVAALRDAHIKPMDVDYIHAHGTGTQSNDAAETFGIHRAFGAHSKKLRISSTKPITGHMLGAAGAMGILACALSIKTGLIPPTLNYETPDPHCDLDYVPSKARKASVRIALSNAFAFGSNNATVVIRREE